LFFHGSRSSPAPSSAAMGSGYAEVETLVARACSVAAERSQ
jgi:hypothetical protein